MQRKLGELAGREFDLVIVGGEHASNRLTAIELPAIIRAEGDRWLEERERLRVRCCSEHLKSKECEEHGRLLFFKHERRPNVR